MAQNRSRQQKGGPDTGGDRLEVLGRELTRHRRRARRQRRQLEAIKDESNAAGAAEAASKWSDAVTEALRIAEVVSREPAHDVAGLVVKFDAAWWWIVEDQSLLDDQVRLWLMRFRRSLHRLAGQP
jgi:hypothetical protein